jgi:hypothetical protein
MNTKNGGVASESIETRESGTGTSIGEMRRVHAVSLETEQ